MKPLIFLSAIFLLASGATCTAFGDNLIVPGHRIGSVVLGTPISDVRRILHQPCLTRRILNGVVEDSWITRLSTSQMKREQSSGQYWHDFFVNVYYRKSRVVQVEVNSPQFHMIDGLSTTSSASLFEGRYRPYTNSDNPRTGPLIYGSRDPGGIPAVKHFVTIEDDVRAGFAWRFGAWGDLWPAPDRRFQEIVIVHQRNFPALLEPDAGNRFIETAQEHAAFMDGTNRS